jgi:hypothetical protein
MKCDENDPRIAKIREIRKRNPEFTAHQIYLSLGVAPRTLKKWTENGWVEPFPERKYNANSPWRKWTPKGR